MPAYQSLTTSDELACSCTATSAVASSVYGLIQTHPDAPDRPLVDFDIALTFIPALLLGVSFGGQTPLVFKCEPSQGTRDPEIYQKPMLCRALSLTSCFLCMHDLHACIEVDPQ